LIGGADVDLSCDANLTGVGGGAGIPSPQNVGGGTVVPRFRKWIVRGSFNCIVSPPMSEETPFSGWLMGRKKIEWTDTVRVEI